MSNGYILLWRKSLDSLVWQDAKFWRLWSWCLLRASWKERTVLLGRTPVRLRPGDLAVTLAEISAGTGLSQKEARSCLALGKRVGCLEVQGTARGTRVRIVKWQEYQRPGADPDFPRPEPPGTLAGTPRDAGPAGSGQAAGGPSSEEKKGNQEDKAQDRGGGAAAFAVRAGDLERFLASYPKRAAQAAARAAWARMAGELPPLSVLLAAVAGQARTAAWTREAGRYIPSPANWLLGRRWLDDAPPEPGVDQWLRASTRPAQEGQDP